MQLIEKYKPIVNLEKDLRQSHELTYAWNQLVRVEEKSGLKIAPAEPRPALCWKYIGTERTHCGRWVHLFRHRKHPLLNEDVTVELPASNGWHPALATSR